MLILMHRKIITCHDIDNRAQCYANLKFPKWILHLSKNTMTEQAQTTRAQRTAMPAQQFKEDIATLKRDIGNLITLAAQIAREGSVTVTLAGQKEPVTFGAQSIKSFRSQINKKLTAIQSEYSLAMRGRRVKRATGRAGGLPNLSLISESYRIFWQGANLGPLTPLNFSVEDIRAHAFPDNQAVVNQLPLLTTEGITSSSLLQSAWATYIDSNGLRHPTDPKLLSVAGDDYLQDALGPALDWLEANTPTAEQNARYQAKLDAGKDVNKLDPPEKFNRNGFKRYWLATIGSFYTVPRPAAAVSAAQAAVGNDAPMSVEVEAQLRAEETRKSVQDEITVLKGVRDLWNQKLQTGAYAPKKTGGKGAKKVQQLEEAELDEYQEEADQQLADELGEEEEDLDEE